MSGIAFGLMGDMMHAGNIWRGMLYGMTTRFRCADPQPVWRLWDAFAIDTAVMVGYWEARHRRPVTLACTQGGANPTEAVLATSYVRRGNATLVSIASWAPGVARCELQPQALHNPKASTPSTPSTPPTTPPPPRCNPISPGASCVST